MATKQDARTLALQLAPRMVCALTMRAEARGESLEGRVAVGCAIRNRMLRRKQTAHEVCLAPAQFSCWAPVGGEANYRELAALVGQLVADPDAAIEDAALRECLWIADGVLSGDARDITKGADHYLTTSLLSSSHRPGWVAAMTWTATIGAHTFYRS
jgi:hypothetical protein